MRSLEHHGQALAQIPSDIRKPLSTRSLKHGEQRIYKTLALVRRHRKQHLANGAINVSSTGGQALTVHEVATINHPAKGIMLKQAELGALNDGIVLLCLEHHAKD